MEVELKREVGKCLNGEIPLYRISLVNNKPFNWLVKAQSYFTKDEKKVAKLNYKNNK